MVTKRRKSADVESLLREARTAVAGFHTGLARGLTERRLTDLAAVERDLRGALGDAASDADRSALAEYADALAGLVAAMRALSVERATAERADGKADGGD